MVMLFTKKDIIKIPFSQEQKFVKLEDFEDLEQCYRRLKYD